MAKLKHIVIAVDDIDGTAEFYKRTFELVETERGKTRIRLSDGAIDFTIIDVKNHGNSLGGPHGLHHFGFQVDDVSATADQVLANGGAYHDRLPGETRGAAKQIKFKDPSGIYFEVGNAAHAGSNWRPA
jgi:catechol 2,3-dioxygenase-like lactoylglutathione lyase family enzyme